MVEKKYMLNQKRISNIVYNLEWFCPYCNKQNLEYHFMDWRWKNRFWCRECHKVVYRKKENK